MLIYHTPHKLRFGLHISALNASLAFRGVRVQLDLCGLGKALEAEMGGRDSAKDVTQA